MHSNPPSARSHSHGKKRPHLKTMKPIIEDNNPTAKTVFDILKWLEESGELKEKYKLAGSNCQDFARNVWHQVSTELYPNPSKYEPESKAKSGKGKHLLALPHPHPQLDHKRTSSLINLVDSPTTSSSASELPLPPPLPRERPRSWNNGDKKWSRSGKNEPQKLPPGLRPKCKLLVSEKMLVACCLF